MMDFMMPYWTAMMSGWGTMSGWMLLWMIPLVAWELFWKGYGMWTAGRNNQLAWFVAILLLNTAGIVPIIYLLFFQNRQGQRPARRRRAR